jgi:hypothetical protein
LRPDASGNVNFTGRGITVYDPLSNPNPALRTPFPNNTIPASRIDIAALELIRRLPQPNLPGFTNNFAATGVGEFNRTNIDTQVNYDSGGRLTLFGRYSISPTSIIDPPIFGEISGPALNGGQLGTAPGRIQVIGIGGTYAFGPRVVLDANVGYTRQRIGAEGFDIVNINAGPPGTGNNGRPLFIKFGLLADINSIQPYATTTYDSLQVQVTRRLGSSIVGTSYTWSKAISYADNDGGPRIQYLPEKERNRGLAGYDRTHNSQTYLVYDLPFGKGQRWARQGWASLLFGGFQVNGVMSIMSGLPFYVVQGNAPNLLAFGSGQAPNQLNPVIRILGGKGLPSQRGGAEV